MVLKKEIGVHRIQYFRILPDLDSYRIQRLWIRIRTGTGSRDFGSGRIRTGSTKSTGYPAASGAPLAEGNLEGK